MQQSISSSQSEFSLYNYLLASGKYFLEDKVGKIEMKRGAYIYKPPAQLHSMYEILSGVVKIGGYSSKGEEVLYDVLRPGDFFGNLQYLKTENFQEFAKALDHVCLRMYAIGFYKQIIVYDPNVSEWFNQYIVSRWCKVEARMFSVCSNDRESRILNLLKSYNLPYIKKDGSLGSVLSLLSKQDLAHLSGTTRQTVANVLKRLQNGGMYEV